MRKALRGLVDEYGLGRAWDRALPFYLIRGRLEPPPRIVDRKRDMEEVHQEIYELSQKYKPCWEAVLYFRYQLILMRTGQRSLQGTQRPTTRDGRRIKRKASGKRRSGSPNARERMTPRGNGSRRTM